MARRVSKHGDKKFKLSVNRNSGLSSCHNRQIRWQGMIEKLSQPREDNITVAEYNKRKKEEQAELKASAGWFSGATYRNEKRKSQNAEARHFITLDVDEMSMALQAEIIDSSDTPAHQWEWFGHTTRSHNMTKPRWRIIIPCSPSIPPEKFDAVSRIVASKFSEDSQAMMDATDPVSFRVAQLMYFPTVSLDQDFVPHLNKGEILDYRDVLEEFEADGGDWKDASQLPTSTKRLNKHRAAHGSKIQDPRTKDGLIGLFCRTWDIEAAIDEWLTDVYEPGTNEGGETRYTYIHGSTSNGAVVFDDGQQLWSTHATDPVFDEVNNSFDLVRKHLFGHLDKDKTEQTKLTNLPSYQAMVDMLMEIDEFKQAYNDMRMELDTTNPKMFEDVAIEEEELNLDEDDLDLIGGDTPVKIKRTKKLPKELVEMNRKHAVAMWNGDAIIINENTHTGIASFSSQTDLNLFYRNRLVKLKNNNLPMKLADYWFEHPYRRSYERGVAFIPGKTPPGVYNLFRGWPVQPEDNGASIERILWHLKNIICCGNERDYQVLIKWMAHRFQRPTERIGFAVVLRGRKGTGKDTVGMIMKRLLNRYYVPINKPEHLTGQFNAHMAQALFIHVEEGFFAGNKRDQGVLQSLVTNESVMVERKGVDPAAMDNYTVILITSNEDWVVPASDDERRWFVLDVSEKKMQNTAYFDALYDDEINNPASQARLMHYLLHEVDLTDFNIRKPPVTAGLLLQKVESLHNVDKWIFTRLAEGSLGGLDEEMPGDEDDEKRSWSEAPLRIPKDALYADYKTWHRDQRFQGERATMDKILKALYQSVGATATRRRDGAERIREIEIPALPIARQNFNIRLGGALDWLDDEDDLIG